MQAIGLHHCFNVFHNSSSFFPNWIVLRTSYRLKGRKNCKINLQRDNSLTSCSFSGVQSLYLMAVFFILLLFSLGF